MKREHLSPAEQNRWEVHIGTRRKCEMDYPPLTQEERDRIAALLPRPNLDALPPDTLTDGNALGSGIGGAGDPDNPDPSGRQNDPGDFPPG